MKVIRKIKIQGNPFYMGILRRHERKQKQRRKDESLKNI